MGAGGDAGLRCPSRLEFVHDPNLYDGRVCAAMKKARVPLDFFMRLS